jgi:hypothetical protein
VLTDGCTYGSLSMTSYTLSLGGIRTPDDDRDAAAPASDVPIDESQHLTESADPTQKTVGVFPEGPGRPGTRAAGPPER